MGNLETFPWDPTASIDTVEAAAEYWLAAKEEGDSGYLDHARDIILRSAERHGYKAPRLD